MFFFVKEFLKKNSVFKDGFYEICWAEKTIVYNVVSCPEFNHIKEICPSFLLKFFRKRFFVRKTENSHFEGTWALISHNGEVKVFDKTRREILTVMTDERVQSFIEKHEKLIGLNTAFLRVANDGLVETFVFDEKKELYAGRDVIFFEMIMSDYVASLKKRMTGSCVSVETLVSGVQIPHKRIKKLQEKLVGGAGKFFDYPLTYSHCDLHFGNVLFEKGHVWYIDVEYARPEIFTYDFFTGMVVSFWDESNTTLLDAYLSGDTPIQSIAKNFFEIAGCEYERVNNKQYLYHFLIVRLFFDVEMAQKRFGWVNFHRYGNYLCSKYLRLIEYVEKYCEKS